MVAEAARASDPSIEPQRRALGSGPTARATTPAGDEGEGQARGGRAVVYWRTKAMKYGLGKLFVLCVAALATSAGVAAATGVHLGGSAGKSATQRLCLNLKKGTLRTLPAKSKSCRRGERIILVSQQDTTKNAAGLQCPQGPGGANGAQGSNGSHRSDGSHGANS